MRRASCSVMTVARPASPGATIFGPPLNPAKKCGSTNPVVIRTSACRNSRFRRTATPALEVRNLSWNNRLKDISLTARAGEIVGLGGLDGQGQRELLLSLFGVLRGAAGEILIDGKQVPAVSGKTFDVYNPATGAVIASVPEGIRGYGHVKERHLKQAKARESELLDAFRTGKTKMAAAIAAAAPTRA